MDDRVGCNGGDEIENECSEANESLVLISYTSRVCCFNRIFSMKGVEHVGELWSGRCVKLNEEDLEINDKKKRKDLHMSKANIMRLTE